MEFSKHFRTVLQQSEVDIPYKKIDYQSKIGLVGSCFVENIGAKLAYYKFQNWINPYGILFNPLAIEKAFLDIHDIKTYTQQDLVHNQDMWHSLHHHSDFSNPDSQKVLDRINSTIKKTHENLKKTTYLIITLGSAWVYYHLDAATEVANCHKIPQNKFEKRLLSVEEIVESLRKSIQIITLINPEIQVILTLSPVRHLKDGMLANSRSKAHLLTAIHQVTNADSIAYFPSYELLMDDLRDYRFYTEDMLHPNTLATTYIWEFFKELLISKEAYPLMKQVDSVQKALQHRPFNPDSEHYQSFMAKIKEQKEHLETRYNILF